jgi:iron complex outermembrane receptor protein
MLSGRTAGDTRTPAGTLGNTGYDAWGATLAAGLRGGWGNATLEYDGRRERLELHEDPAEEPDFTGYQRVSDDRVKATVGLPTGGSARIEIIAGYQRNNRREFEAVDDPAVALGLISQSWSADGHLHHTLGRFAGIVGLSGFWNDVTKSGEETLVPSSSYGNLGLYAFEQTEFGRWQLSFGGRFDARKLNVEYDPALGVSAQERDFGSVTGNVGLLYRASDPVAIVLNAGRGFRAPSTFELFSNGVHPGTARFERGNPDLTNETSFNTDLGLRIQTERMRAEVGGFVNSVADYIYPDPTSEVDPESGFRIYDVAQGNATLVGFEVATELHPTDQLHLRVGADYVRGQNTTTDQPLALMPPFRLSYGVRYEAAASGRLTAPYLDLGGETHAEQGRPDPEEVAPPGYTLFHLGAGVGLGVGRSVVQVDLSVRNLFDTAFTAFLSRYKEYALDAGRNLSLRVSTGF